MCILSYKMSVRKVSLTLPSPSRYTLQFNFFYSVLCFDTLNTWVDTNIVSKKFCPRSFLSFYDSPIETHRPKEVLRDIKLKRCYPFS